jgi:hypothetical protein
MDDSHKSDRAELLRMFVLDAIADDYENLEQICADVSAMSTRCALLVQCSDVTKALVSLIASGLASPYKLRPTAEKVEGIPATDALGSYYYWVTEKGREVQLSDYAGWPFGENGELRKDWAVPTQ